MPLKDLPSSLQFEKDGTAQTIRLTAVENYPTSTGACDVFM